ncbi:polyprenyl synthetase family protein [Metabacillus sediminilitoris]|uniref:Farnesyl diphosphate synthase n=2 Tax=Metabacillus sediminilitoris TaxID=2567941 RepID=A0A4S4BZG9_9BACI|nr:polyprenyl synthetase family protein [Metabacillus sediminilitoris]THF80706.1 polyprenyl synthetase family protein [Metabacillus sediminilitoris]
MIQLTDFLQTRKQRIEEAMPVYIEKLQAPETLKKAMLYSLEAGGKRLRPILVLAVLHTYKQAEDAGIATACAIEMIHTYSLIHDDLPCMDDDDLRRGKPTNHKVFGEAMAVLAGDGLLTQSFSLIVNDPFSSSEKKLRIISELVLSAGAEGMVGGQVADMEGESKNLTLLELQYIHENKTAKLLSFSIISGAILAGAPEEDIEKLRKYAYHLGIAFQIQDDILDIEGSQEIIGKPIGSDTTNEKTTYPSLLTIQGAKEKLSDHIEQAKEFVDSLSVPAELLIQMCDLIAKRDH